MVLTVIAKFIAFGRELAIAAYFGSDSNTDSFFIAYGLIGNILYGLTTAFATAFLPIYIEEKEKNGRVCSNSFAGQSIIFFVCVAIIFSVAIFSFAELLTSAIAPSASVSQSAQIALFIRILTAGLIFSLLNSFSCSLLDAERIFGNTAFSGIIYSLVVVLSAVFFSQSYGIMALVIAVAGANLIQFLFSGIRSKKFITLALPRKNDSRLWKMLLISMPILLSNTTVEINQIINRALAMKLGKGCVSAFSYASTLAVFVTSSLVYSLVTIFFTEFSKAACADNAAERIPKLVRTALDVLLFVLVPVTCITFFFSEDIVTLALKRGKFTFDDVVMTASGLRWMAIGFLAIVVKALFTKCFIALKDTMTPMIVSVTEVALNIGLVFLLYRKFQVAGIAAALAFANIYAALLLMALLHRKAGIMKSSFSAKYLAKFCGLTFVAVLILYWLRGVMCSAVPILRFTCASITAFLCFLPEYLRLLHKFRRR